jgi:hypothetical protein
LLPELVVTLTILRQPWGIISGTTEFVSGTAADCSMRLLD